MNEMTSYSIIVPEENRHEHLATVRSYLRHMRLDPYRIRDNATKETIGYGFDTTGDLGVTVIQRIQNLPDMRSVPLTLDYEDTYNPATCGELKFKDGDVLEEYQTNLPDEQKSLLQHTMETLMFCEHKGINIGSLREAVTMLPPECSGKNVFDLDTTDAICRPLLDSTFRNMAITYESGKTAEEKYLAALGREGLRSMDASAPWTKETLEDVDRAAIQSCVGVCNPKELVSAVQKHSPVTLFCNIEGIGWIRETRIAAEMKYAMAAVMAAESQQARGKGMEAERAAAL